MTHSSKSSSFHKILIIVFGIAFGLVALMMVYQGVKTNMDARSRAAQQVTEYKLWDFTNDAERWVGYHVNSASITSGIFTVTSGSQIGAIVNSSVATQLPQGNKYLNLRMAVYTADQPVLGDSSDCTVSSDGTEYCYENGNKPAPGQSEPGHSGTGYVIPTSDTTEPISCAGGPNGSSCVLPGCAPCTEGKVCPEICKLQYGVCSSGKCVASGTPTAIPVKRRPFQFSIYYWMDGEDIGKAPKSKPLTVKGTIDGVFRQYSNIRIPEIQSIKIVKLVIQFDSGVASGSHVAFDWIRLYGPATNPTPKPTKSIGCTAEAKICPDGSAVGRIPPNCNFAPCPVYDRGDNSN